MHISVIIATRNRFADLQLTLAGLTDCRTFPEDEFEIIVVDSNSSIPLRREDVGERCRIVRVNVAGRSLARNAGADVSRGELLVFLDDDVTVDSELLECYWRAHHQWPTALLVGSVRLPQDLQKTPFGRFRQALEDKCLPSPGVVVHNPNFCTAANMAVPSIVLSRPHGFDEAMESAEDQDFAMRFGRESGCVVFVPEARVVHRDRAIDINAYCKRAEWGMERMRPFCDRYPEFYDNLERERVNGQTTWFQEPFSSSVKKSLKCALGREPYLSVLLWWIHLLEILAPASWLLDKTYRLALGIHILRGYRKAFSVRSGRPAEAIVCPGS